MGKPVSKRIKRSEIAAYAAECGCRVENRGSKVMIAPKGLKGFRICQYQDGSMYDPTVDLSAAASISTGNAIKLLRI